MTPGSRGGKARKMGPSETPEFCAAWEAHDTSEFTGSREMYAQVFRWRDAEIAKLHAAAKQASLDLSIAQAMRYSR